MKKEIINQKNLVEILAATSEGNFNKKQVDKLVKDLFDLIIENLKAGQSVKITSFGTFIPKDRHARKGVNPQKPEERIEMPAVRVTKFKTGKKLKDALKK